MYAGSPLNISGSGCGQHRFMARISLDDQQCQCKDRGLIYRRYSASASRCANLSGVSSSQRVDNSTCRYWGVARPSITNRGDARDRGWPVGISIVSSTGVLYCAHHKQLASGQLCCTFVTYGDSSHSYDCLFFCRRAIADHQNY